MKNYRKAKKLVDVSVGESVRILRELQEMSHSQRRHVRSARMAPRRPIENDRVNLGVERAKVLARVLKCHPAVLVFPGWDVHQESAA